MTVVRGLVSFKLRNGPSCVLLAANDLNYARGYVGSDIVSNDSVRDFRLVVYQEFPRWRVELFTLTRALKTAANAAPFRSNSYITL